MLALLTAARPLIRHLVGAVGVWLAANGYDEAAQAFDPEAIVGVVIAIGTIAWSYAEKRFQSRKESQRIKEAVDAVYETTTRDAALERLRATGGLRDT